MNDMPNPYWRAMAMLAVQDLFRRLGIPGAK